MKVSNYVAKVSKLNFYTYAILYKEYANRFYWFSNSKKPSFSKLRM